MTKAKSLAALALLAISSCNDPSSQEATTLTEPVARRISDDIRDSKPMTDTDHPWRTDPALSDLFHPEYPDDLQVIVHEGGPRVTGARPELAWVRVTGTRDGVYQGTLLNQPQQLPSLKLDDTILFVPANPGNAPFMVTDRYLDERSDWHISPCDECGMPDLFDAPSDLQAKIFPDIPAEAKMDAFTSFCPICGGVQVVSTEPMEDQP